MSGCRLYQRFACVCFVCLAVFCGPAWAASSGTTATLLPSGYSLPDHPTASGKIISVQDAGEMCVIEGKVTDRPFVVEMGWVVVEPAYLSWAIN